MWNRWHVFVARHCEVFEGSKVVRVDFIQVPTATTVVEQPSARSTSAALNLTFKVQNDIA
jgi:hypothetical protein